MMDHVTSPALPIAPGDVRRLAGRTWRCEALLGHGSEGQVWRVRENSGDVQAWKRFHPQSADNLRRDHLLWLVDQPRPSRHFLWPTAITDGSVGLGYLMPLRPIGSVPLGRLVNGVVSIEDRVTLRCAADLASAVAALHGVGLVFRDLSVGNVFFDEQRGSVALCDVDNAARDGRSVPRVRGTPGFIAPEVQSGDVRAGRASDLYALAVLITTVLTRSMPTHTGQQRLDDSWPAPVRELSKRAEGLGASDPAARPEALEWKMALEEVGAAHPRSLDLQ